MAEFKTSERKINTILGRCVCIVVIGSLDAVIKR